MLLLNRVNTLRRVHIVGFLEKRLILQFLKQLTGYDLESTLNPFPIYTRVLTHFQHTTFEQIVANGEKSHSEQVYSHL